MAVFKHDSEQGGGGAPHACEGVDELRTKIPMWLAQQAQQMAGLEQGPDHGSRGLRRLSAKLRVLRRDERVEQQVRELDSELHGNALPSLRDALPGGQDQAAARDRLLARAQAGLLLEALLRCRMPGRERSANGDLLAHGSASFRGAGG